MRDIVEPHLQPRPDYWLARGVLLRALGGVYAVAFLILV